MWYVTDFRLTNSVNDLRDAQDYLLDDDMVEYYNRSESCRDKLLGIYWILSSENKGFIAVETKEPLTADDCVSLSDWISGQNSDGLGEGFEQQRFAEVRDEDGCSYETVSFDWSTNEYHLIALDALPENDRNEYRGWLWHFGYEQ